MTGFTVHFLDYGYTVEILDGTKVIRTLAAESLQGLINILGEVLTKLGDDARKAEAKANAAKGGKVIQFPSSKELLCGTESINSGASDSDPAPEGAN